jgi:hypothetical protein
MDKNRNESSRAELIRDLKRFASQCCSTEEVQSIVNKEHPGVAVTVTYCGPMFMGMAMSHKHRGVISF